MPCSLLHQYLESLKKYDLNLSTSGDRLQIMDPKNIKFQQQLLKQKKKGQEKLKELDKIRKQIKIKTQQSKLQHLSNFNLQIQVRYEALKIQCFDKQGNLIDVENRELLKQYREYFRPCDTIEKFRQKNNKLHQYKASYCPGNLCKDSVKVCQCQKCCDDDVCGNWSNFFRCFMCCSWHILMCGTCTAVSWPYCICCQRSVYCRQNCCPFFYKRSKIYFRENNYKFKQVCFQPCFTKQISQCFCYNGCNFCLDFMSQVFCCAARSFYNVICSPIPFICNLCHCFVNICRNIQNCCITCCCKKNKVLLKLQEIYQSYEKQILQGVKK